MTPHLASSELTRRQLLAAGCAGGVLSLLPGSLLASTLSRAASDRRLVLLFLDGGNDGLNTIVPYGDDAYARARPRLALPAAGVHALDDHLGLHPSLAPWLEPWEAGQLALLPCVGYDDPDRSHFVSRDILHAGRRHLPTLPTGWVGRALDDAGSDRLPAVALGATEAPLVLAGPTRGGLTLHSVDAVRLQGAGAESLSAGAASMDAGTLGGRIATVARDAYTLTERLDAMLERIPAGGGYPDTPLGARLSLAARLVRAEGGPPVLWTSLPGFDTHAAQLGTHAALLDQVGRATTAFMRDLARDGSDERTLLLVYSEFGRRVADNGSLGTDHGAGGPMMLLGGAVQGGVHGGPPDLDDLLDGDVRPRVDFRAVFGELARRWMGWDAAELFDVEPEPVGLAG